MARALLHHPPSVQPEHDGGARMTNGWMGLLMRQLEARFKTGFIYLMHLFW